MNRRLSLSFKSFVLMALIAMLAACSSPANSNIPSEQNANSTGTGSQAASTAVKTYRDFQGREAEIPVQPKRIAVVAGSGAIIDVKELGFEPIGYPYRYVSNSRILQSVHESMSAKAADLGMPTNLEQLVALQPDLIIMGYETQDNEYEMLKKIAPVAAFNEELPMQQRLAVIGEILGKQKEAETILTDAEAKTKAMWQSLREQGKVTVGEAAAVVVYYWNKKMYLMKNLGVFHLINHPDGLKMSKETASFIKAFPALYVEIPEEALHEAVVADRLFLLYDNNADAKEGFKQLKASKVFQSLAPVKNGKVHYIPLEYNDSDLITTRKLIEDFPHILQNEMVE